MEQVHTRNHKIGVASKVSFYDVVVLLYVVAIYAFENSTYVTLFQMIQLLFLGTSLVQIFINKKILISKFAMWLAVFCAFVFLLCAISNQSENWSTMRGILKNAVICSMLGLYVTGKERIERMIAYLGLGGIVASVFMLSTFLSRDLNITSLKYAGELRVGASIAGGNVNVVALYLCFSFASILYYCTKSSNKVHKAILYAALTFVGAASLLTGTRKILIFYLICFTLFHIHTKKRNIILVVSIAVLVYYLIMNVESLYYLIGYKLNYNSSDYTFYAISDSNRERFAEQAMQLFREWPFGIGFGTTISKMGIHSHNNLIEILVSGGIFGFVVYYYIYAWIFMKYWKTKKQLLSQYFLITIFALFILEFWQITYLYSIPMVFICIATTTGLQEHLCKPTEEI